METFAIANISVCGSTLKALAMASRLGLENLRAACLRDIIPRLIINELSWESLTLSGIVGAKDEDRH